MSTSISFRQKIRRIDIVSTETSSNRYSFDRKFIESIQFRRFDIKFIRRIDIVSTQTFVESIQFRYIFDQKFFKWVSIYSSQDPSHGSRTESVKKIILHHRDVSKRAFFIRSLQLLPNRSTSTHGPMHAKQRDNAGSNPGRSHFRMVKPCWQCTECFIRLSWQPNRFRALAITIHVSLSQLTISKEPPGSRIDFSQSTQPDERCRSECADIKRILCYVLS